MDEMHAGRVAAVDTTRGTIETRIVVNAVAAHPMRLKSVEDAVAGKPRNEETAKMAGEMAVQGARPLAPRKHNNTICGMLKIMVATT